MGKITVLKKIRYVVKDSDRFIDAKLLYDSGDDFRIRGYYIDVTPIRIKKEMIEYDSRYAGMNKLIILTSRKTKNKDYEANRLFVSHIDEYVRYMCDKYKLVLDYGNIEVFQ